MATERKITVNLKKVDRLIEKYGSDKSWLVMLLQDIQAEYNYLPQDALERVAAKLNVPLARVHNVATFYGSFSLAERGRHIIRVCDGTACHLRGTDSIRDEIVRQLAIGKDETTPDGKFTLEVVACLGACALAPVITVDSEYHGGMTPEKVREVLDRCE